MSNTIQSLFNVGVVKADLLSEFNTYQRTHAYLWPIKFNTYHRVSASITMEWNVGMIIQPNMRTVGRVRWISMYPGQ
jgi:hypothetical protein